MSGAAVKPVPLPPLAVTANGDANTLPNGREAMYDLVNSGTLSAADDLLNNVWDVPRYKPVSLATPLTWKEDPYGDSYWRFEFYSLRPTSNLLWAYYTTRQTKYLDKLLSILTSFTGYDATNPPPDPIRLDYAHGAAFRGMILVNEYVKLNASGVLPAALAVAMRASIRKLGDFLASPSHYESKYNHGFTEASALLLIAANSPELEQAAAWQPLALSRLTALMQTTVGSDGVEIERSPFYHFYVFDFALQLENWARGSEIALPAAFTDRVASMVRYSTAIIWPNGQIPLIGSSVKLRPAGYATLYSSLEKADPQFAFAVTGGAQGKPPVDRATLFATSGQVVLHSPINPKAIYADNSQLVFNAGPPSTKHSHLDGLAFTYYSGGVVLLPDSGLDTYAPGATFNFFHGTSAHNTVVVDGKDQGSGPIVANLVQAGTDWEYASATASLYAGVSQKRSVLMLGHNLVLVIDSISADAVHTYQQLWHLFPNANLTLQGLTARVSTAQDAPVMQIVQGQVASVPTVQSYYGSTSPLQGWYSETYGQVQKNHVIGYTQHGKAATYLTLLAVGSDATRPATVTGSTTAGRIQLQVCAADTSRSVVITAQATAGERIAVDSNSSGCGHGG